MNAIFKGGYISEKHDVVCIDTSSIIQDHIRESKFPSHVYTKKDLISALKSLETYFKGDDIDRMFFHHQAEIIENSYDYLLARLRYSESERFKV